MADDPKPWRENEPGVGIVDGKLNVVTPEQHVRMAIERNVEEALEDPDDDLRTDYEAEEDLDDVSDLDE